MFYIQRKDSTGLETVDEFTTRTEARDMLAEYRLSDWSANYYISTRCCKAWKESNATAHPMIIKATELNVARMVGPYG